jgi:hypothetical protein
MSRYDTYIQIIPAASYHGMKFFSFGQKRSLGVRGIQKLVNIFTKYLLTPLGTDPLDLAAGTNLTNLIGSNTVLSDAQDILLLAVDKTTQAIRAYQNGLDVPDDERLATASVTDFISIPEAPGFAAQIFVENVVDIGRAILLPTLQVRT